MELVRLRNENIKEFKQLMIDAFQYGYEAVYGKSKEQILPENDIDNDLNNKNSCAYEMLENNQIVGGVVVTIDKETNHNHLDFLFVKVGVQSKGIGQVAKEGIFSGLNNVITYNIFKKDFDTFFGLTEKEVEKVNILF